MKSQLILLLFVSATASAEQTYITIPGEDVSINIDTPVMTSIEGKAKGRIFRYIDSSVETGITVSVNTETEASKNNQQCFEVFWAKAQKNPMMVKSSIKTFKDKKAIYATHHSEGGYKRSGF